MSNPNSKCLVLLAVLLLIPCAALAQSPPPYTYVGSGYIASETDFSDRDFGDILDIDDEGDGFFVDGSFGGKMWRVFAEYAQGSFGSDLDQTRWFAGGGWHGLLGERGDIVADLAYVENEIELPFDKYKDDGYRARACVRYRLIKLLELNGFVNYTDLSDAGSDTSYEANAVVYIWRVGLGVGYETFDDVDEMTAYARFVFGKN